VLHIAESATRFSSTEVRESMFPYILNKVEFAQDSCGAGEQKGGMGIDFYFEFLDDIYLTATLEKTKTKPQGLLEGKEGIANNCIAIFPNGEEEKIGKITRHFLPKGTKLHLKTGGGGGYDMPSKRSTDKITEDIENELISTKYVKTYFPQYKV
jgi:N-methylhydantoinase B